MKKQNFATLVLASSLLVSAAPAVELIAIGTISGTYADMATETAFPLENGVPGNVLGGLGSGLAYAGGTTFLALPDRGPNAKTYNPLLDSTTSFIPRFHTLNLSLAPSVDPVTGLPFTLTPMLKSTTLLSSPSPLMYGTGAGLGNEIDSVTPVGSGEPVLNAIDHTNYFSGRSDNFDANKPSTSSQNGRLDPEGIRISNNGQSVFITDEYGPFVYEFNRTTGKRIRSFKLPANLAATNLSAQGDVEIAGNTIGRIANKGMEGLAITPDGKMLVGFMQANLEQDKKKSLRFITIEIGSGATHEYAYKLTDGSGVSEVLAVNDHQFLVAERDGAGLGEFPSLAETASAAGAKKLFLIDITGATDVTAITGPNADLSAYAVSKTLFLDVVAKLVAAGIDSRLVPAKIEAIAFGQDVVVDGVTKHTLYVANDNDFLATVADPLKLPSDATRGMIANPNKFYVFAFSDAELSGFVPQNIK